MTVKRKSTKRFQSHSTAVISAYEEFHQWVEREQPDIVSMAMSENNNVTTILVAYQVEVASNKKH